MKDGKRFKDFMAEIREINRWLIVKVFLTGMFSGALLAVAFTLIALR